MRFHQQRIALLLFLLTLVTTSGVLAFSKKKEKKDSAYGADEQKRAVHALNRLALGPRPGDVQHSEADIERARTELGYQPTTDVPTGLRQCMEWWRQTAPARSRTKVA